MARSTMKEDTSFANESKIPKLQLTSHAFVIRRRLGRGTLWIPLEQIVAVTVYQNRLDRWLGIGTLRLTFRGSRLITIRRVPDPFAVWKRIKIAKFQREVKTQMTLP